MFTKRVMNLKESVKKTDIMHNYLDEIYYYFLDLGYEVDKHDAMVIMPIKIKENNFKISIEIPNDYPFTFLTVKLINRNDFNFYIPHMFVGNTMCLYVNGYDRHDYKNYLEEAEETVKRAKDILKKAVEKKFENQYKYEFLDIHNPNTSNNKNYLLIEDYHKPKILTSIEGLQNGDLVRVFFDEHYSVESLYFLLKNIKVNETKVYNSVVYIPMKNDHLYSSIYNISDIISALEGNAHFNFFAEKIISGTQIGIIGIFQDEIKVPSIIGMIFPKLTIPKGKIVKKNSFKSILKLNSKREITNIKISDLSKPRLNYRSGDGVNKSKKRIYNVGCGSVGSFIIKNLCDTFEIESIILHDNDKLEVNNIGRHVCGLQSINKYKSDELAKYINNNYPYINTKAIFTSIINEFTGKENNLLSYEYDYLFCVVGDENIEEQLIKLYGSKKLNKPLIIIWIEAFLVAGHILIFNEEFNEKSKKYIFDNNNNINLSVLKDSHTYSKSLAGCQSRFIPYSGFEVQMFVNKCVDLLINDKYLERKGNYHIVVLGNMREARRNQLEIKNRWKAKNNREVLINRFDE